MDKITKLLKKLSRKEREKMDEILSFLKSGKVEALSIKKLKGADDIYRVRAGTLRVIFQRKGSGIELLEISRRNENPYRNY